MNRRRFLSATVLLAGTQAKPSLGQGLIKAEVPLDEVLEAYQPQRCPEWCWAASTSMLFALYDHKTDQKRIAEALFGSPPACATAQPSAILRLLNRVWTDDAQQRFRCKTTSLYDSFAGVDQMGPQTVIDNLNGGDAMLLCTTHHAMVLTEVRYVNTIQGPWIREMGVADPWPSSAGLRSLSNSEGTKVWARGTLTILASIDITDL